jgi:hypothetical protein
LRSAFSADDEGARRSLTNNAESTSLEQYHLRSISRRQNSKMANSTRERKKAASKKAISQEHTSRDESENQVSDINFDVILWILLALAVLGGVILYYNIDKKDNGPFAAFVNNNLLPKNRYQKGF